MNEKNHIFHFINRCHSIWPIIIYQFVANISLLNEACIPNLLEWLRSIVCLFTSVCKSHVYVFVRGTWFQYLLEILQINFIPKCDHCSILPAIAMLTVGRECKRVRARLAHSSIANCRQHWKVIYFNHRWIHEFDFVAIRTFVHVCESVMVATDGGEEEATLEICAHEAVAAAVHSMRACIDK